jgi:predicted ATPase
MGKIKIQNFGPIKGGYMSAGGYIDISKVLLFVGNQGSGKSTVAKLISTLTWIEKALVRGDYKKEWFASRSRFVRNFLTYHRLENYVQPQTVIDYIGDEYQITYEDKNLIIKEIKGHKYDLPQIMYVPAERNFLTYVKSPKEIKMSSASLSEFLTEYDNALESMSAPVSLPINNVGLEYDKLNKRVNVKGKDYKLNITEASSGFQSLAPLYLVSSFLSDSVLKNQDKDSMDEKGRDSFRKGVDEIWKNDSLNDEQRRIALSTLASKFNKRAFINIVEEPEQNLYPSFQWDMLRSLLEFNHNEGNKLIMTTHSPYIINYLTHFVKAYQISRKPKCNAEVSAKLEELVPRKSMVDPDGLKVYQLEDGEIKLLPDYKGLPSDENFLNEALASSNDLFTQLLEIEDLCR